MTRLLGKQRSAQYLFLVLSCFAASAGAAYDGSWTRSECSTYSYHGLNERYVYGGNKGWIDNNVWDSSTVEGVDCASYVCRCLALPGYVAENQSAGYPYTTSKLYAGVDHLVRVSSVDNLQPWDIWVWRAEYGGPSTGHTGLCKELTSSSIVTREALSATIGIVERTRRKQDMVDWGCRFYRRDNWASGDTPTTPAPAPSGSDVIVDNGSSGTSSTGTWGISSGTGCYGSNSLWARDGATYSWSFTPSSAGTYAVYMWWTAYSSRGTAVPVAISHADGTASLTVNQQTNGGQWNLLGTYSFDTSGAVKLTAKGSYPISSCADAVRFVKVEETANQDIIRDNGSSGTSYTGTWGVSGGSGFYGSNSLWARGTASYRWTFTPQQTGHYEVSLWWTEFSSRGTQIPVTVTDSSGGDSLTVNQQTNGGQWNVLGTYYMTGGQSHYVQVNTAGDGSTACADAIRVRWVSN